MTGKKRRKIEIDSVKKGIYLFPNIITSASLFAGFYAIVKTFHKDYLYAAYAIGIGIILDGLDGRIARLTNTTTRFGVEYDSLSDLVAFGVAPGVLVYMWALTPFKWYGWVAASAYVICGAVRLARFNIQIYTVESRKFNGLPIPAAAAVMITSIMLFFHRGGSGTIRSMAFLLTVAIVAILMVTNIKYYSFKDLELFKRKPFSSFVIAIFIMIVIMLEPQYSLFALAVSYAFSGPVTALYSLVKRVGETTSGGQDDRKN